MNLFRSLGLAAWAWRSALPMTRRASIWFPFLIDSAAQVLTLWLLVEFHRAWLLPASLPILRLLGGEAATHYPASYYYLPLMFSRATLVLSIFVASIAGGVATLYFARGFGADRALNPWRQALRVAPTLIVLSAIAAALLVGATYLIAMVPRELVLRNQLVRWSARGGTLLAVILIQGFLAYATAWVVLEGSRVLPALRDSIRVTARTFLPTMILVGIPVVLLYPLSYLVQRIDIFATKLAPEVIAGVLLVRIVLALLFSFMLVGAITRLFVWRMEAAK